LNIQVLRFANRRIIPLVRASRQRSVLSALVQFHLVSLRGLILSEPVSSLAKRRGSRRTLPVPHLPGTIARGFVARSRPANAFGRVGVLRLRGCFASQSSSCAQNDSPVAVAIPNSISIVSAVGRRRWAPRPLSSWTTPTWRVVQQAAHHEPSLSLRSGRLRYRRQTWPRKAPSDSSPPTKTEGPRIKASRTELRETRPG